MMSAGREEIDARKAVEHALRRQASSADVRRDVSRLPQFRVDQDLPERFSRLLGEIERVERRYR